LLYFSVIFQFLGKFEEDDFSLFLVGDGTTLEVYISLNLGALFEELDGVLDLEVEVVIVGIGTKPDLLHDHLGRFGFSFLFLFLLFVEEFLIIHHLTNGGIGIGYNFYQVELLFLGNFPCFFKWIDIRFNILSNEPYLGSGNIFIDIMLIFLFLVPGESSEPGISGRTSGFLFEKCRNVLPPFNLIQLLFEHRPQQIFRFQTAYAI
jgi:hypothetical protein